MTGRCQYAAVAPTIESGEILQSETKTQTEDVELPPPARVAPVFIVVGGAEVTPLQLQGEQALPAPPFFWFKRFPKPPALAWHQALWE